MPFGKQRKEESKYYVENREKRKESGEGACSIAWL
jgi:hypothetical protein